jgi:membrane-bound ClpP family serine protease
MFLEVFLFMDPKILLEIFGYIGTALVLVSFLMHDIKWLRAVNMAGGAISLIYAIIMNTMPVVVLNGSLILINGVQLARILRREREMKKEKETSTNEADN